MKLKLAQWHQELLRFLDIKTAFLLEGNVFDLQPYPVETENGERRDMVMLDNFLFRLLCKSGYDTVVYYNHIDGFYNNYSPEHLKSFLDVCGLKLSGDAKTYTIKFAQAADVIRKAMLNKQKPVAIILTVASRYLVSSSHLSEAERDFYTKLMLSSLKKTQIKTEKGFVNNIMFVVCNKANDVPAWFYLENPMLKTLNVPLPDKSTRRQFADSQEEFFLGGETFSPDELDEYKDSFADLTDGFQNLELNALKLLCRNENFSFSRIRDAINMYKYGIKENPWNDIEAKKLEAAESFINTRVKGQNNAVVQTLDVIKRAACDMAGLQHSGSGKPKGILFFAGPTGVGKTELAKTTANLLFGDDNACIRFDMSEYQQPQSDQKLLGAPPGYVGYESGGQLTNAVREKPFSIVLFDEIEKAHPSVFDKFLQILEDGRMTDGKGETVYFSECIIIFTSNLGVYETDEMGHKHLNISPDMSYDDMRARLISSIQNYFKLQLGRPELLNRIGNNFVIFDFIRENSARQILESQLSKIRANILKKRNVEIVLGENANDFLLKKSFGNIENGGRGIGNIVEKYFINPVAREMFDKKLSDCRMTINNITEHEFVGILDYEVSKPEPAVE